MKVGILGSGDVGKTLAAGFLKHDHAVVIGTRAPEKLAEWGRKNPRVALAAPMKPRNSRNWLCSR